MVVQKVFCESGFTVVLCKRVKLLPQSAAGRHGMPMQRAGLPEAGEIVRSGWKEPFGNQFGLLWRFSTKTKQQEGERKKSDSSAEGYVSPEVCLAHWSERGRVCLQLTIFQQRRHFGGVGDVNRRSRSRGSCLLYTSDAADE